MKTMEQMLVLREKQLAACTRAMLDAALSLDPEKAGEGASNDSMKALGWEDAMNAAREALLAVRATVMPTAPRMEAVERAGKIYLLTATQAAMLDRAVIKDASGESPASEVAAVLAAAECYPLDAARKL